MDEKNKLNKKKKYLITSIIIVALKSFPSKNIEIKIGGKIFFTFENLENNKNILAIDIYNIVSKKYVDIEKIDIIVKDLCNKTTRIINLNLSKLFSEDNKYIDLFLERINTVYDRLQTQLNIPINEIDMLSNNELDILSKKLVNHIYPINKSFLDIFSDVVRKYPNKIAVKYKDKTITFMELDKYSNHIANEINELNISNNLIGVCIERSIEYIIAIIGILKSNHAFVPIDLDTLNPGHENNYPSERMKFMCDDCKFDLILVNDKSSYFEDRYSTMAVSLNSMKQDDFYGIYPTDLNRVIYGIYTSGSTGKPKVVEIKENSLLNLYYELNDRCYSKIPENSAISINAPFGFDASIQQFVGLLAGHTLIIVPTNIRHSIHQFMEFIIREKITVLDCTPSQLNLMSMNSFLNIDKKDLYYVLVGGEDISDKLWNRIKEDKGTIYINVYGPTECTVEVTFYNISNSSYSTSILGEGIRGGKIYVVDSNMKRVGINIEGEIIVSGYPVAKGYLNREKLNKEKFIQIDGEIFYRTNDLGVIDENGNLKFKGRNDSQIKLHSHRIELKEIDSNIINYHGVMESKTAHISENDNNMLVSFVHANKKITIEELRNYLGKHVPYYMLPNYIIFVDEIKLNKNGKEDIKFMINEFKENRNKEKKEKINVHVLNIAKKILNDPTFTEKDNFIHFGGDSLKIMTLLASIYHDYEVEVEFEKFYEQPTIEFLVEKIIYGNAEED